MAELSSFKDVFDQFATDGYLGDPSGKLAYAYIRVSSAGQAEEGRSGLPRQLLHVHEIAAKKGLKIPWELIFADDHTGFEFRDRPALSRLRQEFKSGQRRASAIVMEYLDRLSRNADWHQGFLLEEMHEHSLEVVFWKAFSSRIEQAVIGAISQEGMEQAKQRMTEGTLMKAMSGRVTTKNRAYGYIFVDSQGRTGETAKKDTHYALHPDEAKVIELVYTKYALEGWTLRKVTEYLQEHVPPPKRAAFWELGNLSKMLKNPLYKGEYIARRFKRVRMPKKSKHPDEPVRLVATVIERPREEWIVVPVPPVVSAELWEMANRMLEKNAQMARRNAKEPFLLTGLIKCADCNASYIGSRRKKQGPQGQMWDLSNYRCPSRGQRTVKIREAIGCTQGVMSCKLLDEAVWSAICQIFLEPERLLAAVERTGSDDANRQVEEEISFLTRQIREKDIEDEKLYRAYQADVFDEHEYAARRKLLKDSRRTLEAALAEKQQLLVPPEQLEERKRMILDVANRVVERGLTVDASFEVKQRIIKLVVDRITLNQRERWFQLDGIVRGRYAINDDYTIGCKTTGSTRRRQW